MRMERLFLLILCCVNVISQSATDKKQHVITKRLTHNDYDPDSWRSAANYLQQYINDKLDPCEEFSDYVCGNYDVNVSMNSNFYDDIFQNTQLALSKTLVQLVEAINMTNAYSYEKSIKTFYDQCISLESESTTEWPKQLYEAIASRIGELQPFSCNVDPDSNKKSPSMAWNLLGKIEGEFNAAWGIRSTLTMLRITPAKFYLEPFLVTVNATELTNLTELLTSAFQDETPEQELRAWLDPILALNDEVKNISSGPDTLRAELITMNNASKIIPSFDWKSYFQGLLPDSISSSFLRDPNTTVYAIIPDKINALGNLFEKYDFDTIRSLVFLYIFEISKESFFGHLQGINSSKDRCLEFGKHHLPAALAKLYFKWLKIDIMEYRQEIIMIARNVFSGFRFLLNNVDWMDAEDKEKMQRKVDNIVFYPGIPSWINDENKVLQQFSTYDPKVNLFENEYRASNAQFLRVIQLHFSPNAMLEEEQLEEDLSFEINAQYEPAHHGIRMFLGRIVPPFYNISYPLALKYGGLGSTIGHELMHAFDSSNIYFSGNPYLSSWLKPNTFKEFEARKRCLVRQYSMYCYKDKNQCVSGDRTITENIADIDGLKVAFTAYKFASEVFGNDPPLPGMLNYTEEQIFFMSFARLFCSKGWLTFLEHDVHAPNKARTEVTIKNVRVFARAFSCKVGSKYAPLKRCSIWGDLANPSNTEQQMKK